MTLRIAQSIERWYVTPDGKRFLMVKQAAANASRPSLIVISLWDQATRAKTAR